MKHRLFFLFTLCGAGLAQVCVPTGVIQLNATLSDALTASNCTLSDGTSYADYLVVFPTRGNWTATVTAADGLTPLTLILRDSSGAKLASGASVQFPVERGGYHLLVNASAPGQAAGYQIATKFTAASSVLCSNFGMMGTTRPVTGLLTPASCKLPDGSAYDGYQLTLYGTGTVDIAVTSTSFTPLPILRTSDGYALSGTSSTDANGTTHLTIASVGNDTYTLVVAVSSPDQSGGSYSVSASFTPDVGETCTSQTLLTATQQSTGSISLSSCGFNLPGRDDDALFNYYQVHLDQAGVIQASLTSVDFSSLLLLLDAGGNPLSADIEGGGDGAPLVQQQLPAGDYLLIVFNEDSFGGSYTLNYRYTAGPIGACPVTSMNPGDEPSGILAGGVSCKDGGYLADTYQIVLPADGTVTLLLSSPDFSSLADLHDAKDNDLTWGAQSDNGSTSYITANLKAGTYYVYAASMDLPGAYSLGYTFTPSAFPSCSAPMSMPPNGYIQNAQLTPASCQGADGRLYDSYAFVLPAPSTEAVFMLSQSVPPDVTLYKSDGTPLRHDLNSYAGDNAAIVQYLPAGSYLVRARSADPNAAGPYDLYLDFRQGGPPQLCAPYNLPSSGTLSGQTSFTSCAWYDKTFASVYQLNVTDSTQIFSIGATSTDTNLADLYLLLMDAKGNVLSTDDNSGGGLNPLIVQALDPGTYFVVVKPADDPSSAGAYNLSVSSSPPAVIPNVKRK